MFPNSFLSLIALFKTIWNFASFLGVEGLLTSFYGIQDVDFADEAGSLRFLWPQLECSAICFP